MTKKHFIGLAKIIKERPGAFSEQNILTLAAFLAEQNPKFNAKRWLDYIAGRCGPHGGKVCAK